jgi:hypothetical protein
MSKAVSITLNDEDYEALKKLAEEEDRYISGQARHMLRESLHPELPPAVHQNPTSATSDTPQMIGNNSPHPTLGELERAKQDPLPG